jgi:hypothetical protein
MSLRAALETVVVFGFVPAATIVALGFTLSSHYSEAVSENLIEKENALITQIKDEERDPPANVRTWSRAFQTAHNYRDIHSRSFWVSIWGAFSWFGSYLTEIAQFGQFLFTSPLGVPADTGLKILAILAWGVWVVYAIRMIRRFGVRPHENVSEEGHGLGAETD